MKLLLDTCVWSGAKAHLEAVGHDVVWTGDWPQDPGDEEILARAHAEERVLVTLDKDFGEMAVHRGLKHHGVLRLVGFRSAQQASAAEAALKAHGADLESGAIVTAEPGRLRIRPARRATRRRTK
jgi:predicted nuclease of predicted toxin-antitoxin system